MGLKRILLMTYFPSGFWSRLITRLLADEHITEAIKSVYIAANDVGAILFFCYEILNISLHFMISSNLLNSIYEPLWNMIRNGICGKQESRYTMVQF